MNWEVTRSQALGDVYSEPRGTGNAIENGYVERQKLEIKLRTEDPAKAGGRIGLVQNLIKSQSQVTYVSKDGSEGTVTVVPIHVPIIDAKKDEEANTVPFYNGDAFKELRVGEEVSFFIDDEPCLWNIPGFAKNPSGQHAMLKSFEETHEFKVWLYNEKTKESLKQWTWKSHVRMENSNTEADGVKKQNLKYTIKELAPAKEDSTIETPILTDPVAQPKTPYEWTTGWKASDGFINGLDSAKEKENWGGAQNTLRAP